MQTGADCRHSGHGRGRPDLLHLRDGRARRRWPGDRTRPGSAARNRHDSLRDHAERVAGAHAAGGREGPRRRSLPRLRKVGPGRGHRRARHPRATMRVLEHGKVVAEIPNQLRSPTKRRSTSVRWSAGKPPVPREMPDEFVARARRRDFTAEFKQLLASPNICSKRWVYRAVRLHGADQHGRGPGRRSGVIRIKGTRPRALAMALDGNGRWCYLDPKLGAMHAVAEARAQRGLHRRDSRGRDQLPELRQSREAAHHVAVLAGHRRHRPRPAKSWTRRSPAATSASTTRRWAKASIPRRCSASSGFWKT